MRSLASLVVFAALALAAHAARAANDAGASTFESGAALYRATPVRAEDVRVPPVQEKPPNLPTVPDTGPGDSQLEFSIDRFDVSGNTLLIPSRIDEALAPFRGEKKRIADVQAARDALQKAYDDDGLLTVAVTIPQQTIDHGIVRLDVVEARVGAVAIENEGVRWFSDEGVRDATPHIQPGALLRRDELEADIAQANSNPDRRVRPTLRNGAEPGTVDVGLIVEDRIALHGSVTLSNDHAPGSPANRLISELRYANLWGLEHEIGVAYQMAPSERFSDVQIVAGTYRAPMPWDPGQSLFYYVVYSDTQNGVVTAPDLSVLGNGLNMGLRYRIELPEIASVEGFSHAFALGIDRKDIENSVTASESSITTPITYVPFSFEYSPFLERDHALTSASLGFSFNRAGMVPGGSRQDFEANRPGATGNYEVLSLSLQEVLRLPSVLQTLAAGRFIELAEPTVSFSDDWTFHVRTRGQVASQPLISTEQFSAGGLDSVRGYLQSEQFGDDGWSAQFEVRTATFRGFLGGWLSESAHLVGFYDAANLHLQDASEGQQSWTSIQGYGFGIRASLLERLNAEFFVARPRISTQYTESNQTRFYFQIGAGF